MHGYGRKCKNTTVNARNINTHCYLPVADRDIPLLRKQTICAPSSRKRNTRLFSLSGQDYNLILISTLSIGVAAISTTSQCYK